MILLLGSAVAASHYVESYAVLPEPLDLGGVETQQLRQQLILSCEDRLCVIQDYAIQARAVPGQEALLQAPLEAVDAALTGARVDIDGGVFVEGGSHRSNQLLQRALVGLDLEAGEGRWEEPAGALVELPMTNSSANVTLVHKRAGDRVETQGVGRLDAGKLALGVWVGGEARFQDGVLVERSWWSIGRPYGGAPGDGYLQGGCVHPTDQAHALDPTGPLEEHLDHAHSVQILQEGLRSYSSDDDDLREGPLGASVYTRVTLAADVRRAHDTVGAGELWLGIGYQDFDIGLAWHSHLPRSYRPVGELGGVNQAHPVQMQDLLLGLSYRRDRLFIPRLGVVWGVSLRHYPGAEPERIWMPVAGPELGLGLQPGSRTSVELSLRVLADGAATRINQGQSFGTLSMVTGYLGLAVTTDLFRW